MAKVEAYSSIGDSLGLFGELNRDKKPVGKSRYQ
jgi:hypothetical protein